jgi:hypothetical protein
MSEAPLRSLSSLSPAEGRLVEKLCSRFEAGWQRGKRPRLENYRQDISETIWPVLFRELLALEVTYRLRNGERPTAADYAARFPSLQTRIASLLAELLAEGVADPGRTQPYVPEFPLAIPVFSDSSTTPAPAIPGHEILGELGAGAMGVVYKARHLRLGRIVALKIIRPNSRMSAAEEARFRTEAEAIARLQHPHIVQIHEIGEWRPQRGGAPQPYFALEFCAGGNWGKKLAGAPLPPAEAAAAVETLARAVQAAHDKHIIHRDLKPANVLIDADGRLKITDFGLAKKLDDHVQTISGAVMGTPSYMAPEQAAGLTTRIGRPADVYALGAILYECLTGRPPFRGPSVAATLHQVIHDDPLPPSRLRPGTPRDLETICLKCLRKEPENRYPSAQELADDLGRFRRGEPIRARPVGRAERTLKWARRNRVATGLLGAAAVGALAATCFAVIAFWYANRASRSDIRADTSEVDLRKKKDELLTNEARQMLQVLAAEVRPNQPPPPPNDSEREELWKLAASPDNELRLRFFQEALRDPVLTRQLKDRRAFAVNAAVGLDATRRVRVERLLGKCLQSSDTASDQRADVALILAQLGVRDPATARKVVAVLIEGMRNTGDPDRLRSFAQGVAAAASPLEPKEATTACGTVAALLVKAMRETSRLDLAAGLALAALGEGLSAVAGRLESRAARDVAATLALALIEINDPDTPPVLSSNAPPRVWPLAQSLSAVIDRLEPTDARETLEVLLETVARAGANDLYAFQALLQRLPTVASRMEAKEAVATLLKALREKDHPDVLRGLAEALSAVAGRLELQEAEQAVVTLLKTMRRTTNATLLAALARSLSAVAARMEPKAAARRCGEAAVLLTTALSQRPNFDGFGDQFLQPDRVQALAEGLSAVAPRLESKAAGEAAAALVTALGKTRFPNTLHALAQCLSIAASRMEPREVLALAATLTQAMRPTAEPLQLKASALAVAAVASRLEPKDAAAACNEAAATLAQALDQTTDPTALLLLVEGLSAVLSRLEPVEAAKARAACRRLAVTLTRTMDQTTDALLLVQPPVRFNDPAPTPQGANELTLLPLARCLSVVGPWLEATDAGRMAESLTRALGKAANPAAVEALVRALSAVAPRLDAKQAGETATALLGTLKRAKNPNTVQGAAQGLSAVAPRVSAKEAGEMAETLTQALSQKTESHELATFAQALAAVASRLGPKEAGKAATTLAAVLARTRTPELPAAFVQARVEPLFAQYLTAATSRMEPKAAADLLLHAMSRTTDRDVLELLSQGHSVVLAPREAVAPLATRQLVELLKHPLCANEARRLVLDQLGNRCQRHFEDSWEFVRFAEEQQLGLDFAGPVQRP